MYNPSLGRFNTIDPYSQFNSPYLAMANNPVSFVDPDGGRANYAGMNEAEVKRHLNRLKKEEKEWWDANRNNYRRRGGDHDGSNWYYHQMNMLMYGKTVLVDPADLNSRGDDGSFASGDRNTFFEWVYPARSKEFDREGYLDKQDADLNAFLKRNWIADDIDRAVSFVINAQNNKAKRKHHQAIDAMLERNKKKQKAQNKEKSEKALLGKNTLLANTGRVQQ
jgi:hypothetical protein